MLKQLFKNLNKIKTTVANSELPSISVKRFRTPIEIFEAGLRKWEEEGVAAPIWLTYENATDAQQAVTELRLDYAITHVQTISNIIVVNDQDAKRLVSIIKRLQVESRLELFMFRFLQQWLKYNKPTNSTLVTLKFDTQDDAIIARRILINRYNIHDVVRDRQTIILHAKGVKRFLAHYNDTFTKLY